MSGAQGGGQKSMPLDTATTSGALAEVHLLLAPNPASDQMRISLSAETGVGLLLIHDGHGREVYRQTMNSPTTTLDVSSFSTGPYYMSFVRDTERIVSGFAIQR
ncbi:MAG TPA: T9SS type A sorting domain-containing protein [Flavobacteriales bacterium]|nr:T9SS type A sorting domain-containing protein [Flavobacteriales bacterium]